MPPKLEVRLEGVLITCVGFLASSLGVFISVLSVIISPLFSLFSTPKPIFIGVGKIGPTPRLQHPSRNIRPRLIRPPPSDQHSSHSSNTLSSNGTADSIYSGRTTGNESRRTPSPDGTRFRNNTSEPAAPSQPSTPGQTSGSPPPSQPRSPRNGLRNYLNRKTSALRDETAPREPGPTTRDGNLDLDEGSHEQELYRAEIIISPPTPSSSVFLRSTPGPSKPQLGDVSTASKPAARFVKSHSKRHSLSTACPRKRRSGKRSSNPPTPKPASPATTPVVESRWNITTRTSKRKKRKSLRIDPPPQSATSPVHIETGDDVGDEIIYEEPASITRSPAPRLPPTPARQGPVRTRPYEAPYFFPLPGSPEAFGYVEKVREERRSGLVSPDVMSGRNKKDPKRSFTASSLEKDGTASIPKLRGEGGHNKPPGNSGVRRPKSSGDLNPSSSTSLDEFGVRVGTPPKFRKASAPAQLNSPSPDTASTPATPSRHEIQRRGSLGIMRILGKH